MAQFVEKCVVCLCSLFALPNICQTGKKQSKLRSSLSLRPSLRPLSSQYWRGDQLDSCQWQAATVSYGFGHEFANKSAIYVSE